ncbi:hypothetical protein ABK040_005455 [Willaertia magna]
MAMTEPTSTFDANVLHYGDTISLCFEKVIGEKYHLSIRGDNARCGLTKKSEIKDFSESLFVVCKGGSFTDLKRYNAKYQELIKIKSVIGGLSSVEHMAKVIKKQTKRTFLLFNNTEIEEKEPEDEKIKEERLKKKELKKYEIKMLKEKEQNEVEEREAIGQPVCYGDRIRLFHLQSQLYLDVQRGNAEIEKACLGISLALEGSRTFFQILPKYKFRQEGDEVRLSDSLIIINEKSKHSLHRNMSNFTYAKQKIYGDNRHEVNCSSGVLQDVWNIHLYCNFNITNKYLRTGDIIRLFNKDVDSYIQKVENSIKFYSSSLEKSINSLFEVEFREFEKGGYIFYNTLFCLKHIATGKFLTVKEHSGSWEKLRHLSKGESTFRFELSEKTSDDTLFSFHSPDSLSDEDISQPIRKDSLLRIKHFKTDNWLLAPNVSLSNITDILLSPSKKETGVFSINFDTESIAITSQIKQIQMVVSNYLELIKEKQLAKSDLDIYARTLENIKSLCCSHENQTAFKDTGVIDILLQNAVETPSGDSKLNFNVVNKQCLEAILSIIRGNLANSTNLFDNSHFQNLRTKIDTESDISLIQSMTELTIGAIKDNMQLLNRLKVEQINQYFIDFKKYSYDEQHITIKIQYLKLFTHIIHCGERPVQKNQNTVVSLLYEQKNNIEQFLAIPKEKNGEIFVGEKTLQQFCENKLNYEYLFQTVSLLAYLCLGKNNKGIKFVSDLLSIETIISCMNSDVENWKLYGAFSELIEYCYVDVVDESPIIRLTRKWGNTNDQDPKKLQEFKKYRENLKTLKELLLSHFNKLLNETGKVIPSAQYTFQLVKVCYKMFLHRVYSIYGDDIEGHKNLDSYASDHEEIKIIADNLLRLLPLPLHIEDEESKGIDAKTSELFIKIKSKICDIFLLIMDLRIDFRISLVIDYLNAKSNNTLSDPLTTRLNKIAFSFDTPSNEKQINNGKRNVNEIDKEKKTDFLEVMLGLLQQNNVDLQMKVLKLIIRSHTQKYEVREYTKNVVLLTSPILVRAYETIYEKFTLLSNLVNSTFSGETENDMSDYQTFKKTVHSIIDIVRQNGDTARSIIRNLQIHELMIQCLSKEYPDAIKFQVYQLAVKLLTEFVRNNIENQKELGTFMQFFVSILSEKLDTSELLCELVRDNKELLNGIDEKIIHLYIDKVIELNRKSHHLNFLRVLTRGSNINQVNIAVYLTTERKDMILLYNEEGGIEEREKEIKSKQYLKPGSKLNYHINLLYLLQDFTRGEVKEAEIKIQSILSFDDCLKHLSQKLIPLIRDPLMGLVDELYINTEKKSQFVTSNTRIWELFKRICQEINYYVENKGKKTTKMDNDKTYETMHIYKEEKTSKPLTDYDEEQQNDFYVSDKYIFTIAIPLIKNFFNRDYFTREFLRLFKNTSEKDILDEVNQFLKLLNKLYTNTANNRYRKIVVDCADIVYIKVKAIDSNYDLEQIEREDMEMIDPLPIIRPTINTDEVIATSFNSNVEEHVYRNEQKEFKSLAEILNEKYKNERGHLIKVCQNVLTKDVSKEYLETFIGTIDTIKSLITEMDVDFIINNGVPELVLNLLTSNFNEMVKQGLELGKEMLTNDKAREKVNTLFKSGNYERFFHSIKTRLRQSAYEVKEHKKRNVEHNTEENNSQGYKETSYGVDVLKFLQLLCEGHYAPNQEMMHSQQFNKISVDILTECVDYVFNVHKYLSKTSFPCFLQAIETLNEFIQGPSKTNQNVLAAAKKTLFSVLGELSNNLKLESLVYSDKMAFNELSLSQSLDLLEKIIILLTSLLEGNNAKSLELVKMNMKNTELLKDSLITKLFFFSSIILQKDANNLREVVAKQIEQDKDGIDKDQVIKKLKEIGISIYILFEYLGEVSNINKENIDFDTGDKDKYVNEFSTVMSTYRGQVGSIEILRNNDIEVVHFPIPEKIKMISKDARDEFVEVCDRESAQTKVKDLFSFTFAVARIEIEHFTELNANPDSNISKLFNFVQEYFVFLRRGLFLLVLLLNIFIVADYQKQFDPYEGPMPIPGVQISDDLVYRGDFNYVPIGILVKVLGFVVLVYYLVVSTIYLTFFLKLKIKKRFKLTKNEKWDNLPRNSDFTKKLLWAILQDHNVWWILLYFVVTVLSILISPLIFIGLTIELVFLSPDALDIIKGIAESYQKLLSTAVLALFTIVSWTFVYFSWKWDQLLPNDEMVCSETLTCFMSIVNYGLRGGGFWEDITPANPLDVGRLFLDLFFSLVVIIVLVGIVFGIVLESFEQRREEKSELEEEKTKNCFICSKQKAEFDVRANEGINFEKHITCEHNMWHYVYFLLYIEEKDKDEYTGIEQFVSDLAAKESIAFFPILRSKTLEQAEESNNQNLPKEPIEESKQIENYQLLHNQFKRDKMLKRDEEIMNGLFSKEKKEKAKKDVNVGMEYFI